MSEEWRGKSVGTTGWVGGRWVDERVLDRREVEPVYGLDGGVVVGG